MRIAARLKELRETAELTQGELADRAGLGVQTIQAIEQGSALPSWPTLQAIVAGLKVSLASFDDLEQEEPRPRQAGKKKGKPKK